MTDKERYSQVCFELKQKQAELESIKLDLFVLNPHIKDLVAEIGRLTIEKDELEDKIND